MDAERSVTASTKRQYVQCRIVHNHLCWRVGGVGLTRLPTNQVSGFPGREFESLTLRAELFPVVL